MTVDCLACAEGLTIEQYCEKEENEEKEGCKGVSLEFLCIKL